MPSIEQIEDFGRRIGEEFRPRQVLLFGSYARGVATPDSDVDVLVVMPFAGRSVDKSVEIRLKTNPPFPLDLLVRTPAVVQQRIKMGDCFLRNILRDGKVLYERHGNRIGHSSTAGQRGRQVDGVVSGLSRPDVGPANRG